MRRKPRDGAPTGRAGKAESPGEAPQSARVPAAASAAAGDEGPRARGRRSVRLLRTAEVLSRAGITHQVLYRYVTLGLIEPATETPTGQRLFRPEVVDLILIIRHFNQRGYSLRDLKDTFFRDKNVRRLIATGAGKGAAKEPPAAKEAPAGKGRLRP